MHCNRQKSTYLIFTPEKDTPQDFSPTTGQLCRHFFLTSGQHETGTWDPNYNPGVDFLDHDFL
jgi:hypothetical protein